MHGPQYEYGLGGCWNPFHADILWAYIAEGYPDSLPQERLGCTPAVVVFLIRLSEQPIFLPQFFPRFHEFSIFLFSQFFAVLMSYVRLSFYAAEFSISSGFIMFDILISSTLNEYEGKRIKNPGTSFLLSCVINMLRCCIVLAPVVLRCCISMIHSSYNTNC